MEFDAKWGSKMEPKTMPKLIKIQCQNLKCKKKRRKSLEIMLFLIVKSLKFILKTRVFYGLEGCMRER